METGHAALLLLRCFCGNRGLVLNNAGHPACVVHIMQEITATDLKEAL